jgi:uncharacterized membrane protein
MKRLALAFALCCVAGLVLGFFFAAVVGGSPASWMQAQGRPPRLVALLALGPIVLVGAAAIVVTAVRRRRAAKDEPYDRSARMRPNQSIERNASGTLRVPAASAHLER